MEQTKNKTAKITGYTHEGHGVARIDDKVVFVKDALVNEEVEIEIIEGKKNYTRGKILEIKKESPHRVAVDAATSGGCNLAHATYEHQLEIKDEIIKNSLRMIQELNPDLVKKTKASEQRTQYRNKGHFQVRKNKEGKLAFGFYEEGSHQFTEAKSSILYSEQVNRVLQKALAILNESDLSVYNKRDHKGFLRHVMIRESSSTGEIMLVLITSESKKLPKSIVQKLYSQIPEVVSLYQNVNTTRGHEILGKKNSFLQGKETIKDTIGEYVFDLYPGTFFQVNNAQTENMYQKVLDYLAPEKTDLIVDAYGGIGTIGTFVAEKADKVISIDEYPEAEKEGIKNAENNKVENLEFKTGKVEYVFPALEEKIDAVIVDPPRAGCKKEVLDAIIDKAISKVVYVSCNPGTLGRDLKILVDGGYEIKEIQPFDNFPQTSHVETVVLMSRVDK